MRKGSINPHLYRAKIKICPICKKEFRAIKDQNGKFGGKIKLQKYCSKECWNRRNPPEIKKCIYCQKEFKTYERKTKIYCSKKCYDLDKQIRMKGEKSHLWQGGKTQKNKLLRTQAKYRYWRKKIFERDNWTCQKCNAKSQKGKRIYLEAHHIKHINQNPNLLYEINNGITLCRKCHKETDNYGWKARWKNIEKLNPSTER